MESLNSIDRVRDKSFFIKFDENSMHLRVWSKYHSDSDAFLSRLKRFCSGYTVEKVAISKFIQPIKARGEVRPIFHRGSVLSASCLLSNEEERGRGIFRWKINERICRLLFLLPSPSLSLSLSMSFRLLSSRVV